MARNWDGSSSNGRSIGQLINDLLRQGSELLQEELALARTEMSGKLPVAGRSVGMIVGGGFLAYAGVLALIAAAIIGLHALLPWWASALVVGVIVLAISYVLIQAGVQNLKHTSMVPRRTLASFKRYQERPATTAFSRHAEGGF
jgi:Putative Actinobacterial Holin-X, holin superfamily III